MKPLELFGKLLNLMRKLRFYEVVLLLCIAVVVGAWSLIEITESAIFCGNTCHIMRSYYQDWKDSSHNQVSCVECHNPEQEDTGIFPRFRALAQVASYFTRTYGEHTRAEVSDAGCLLDGCHSKRLLDGKVTFQGNILFDHRPHLQQLRRGKILRCTSCHSQVAMGNHITVVTDTCYICHLKDRESSEETARCSLCHNITDNLAPSSGAGSFDHTPYIDRGVSCDKCHQDVIRGEAEVDDARCVDCHTRPVELDASRPVELLHRTHVTDHSVACAQCHEPIRHSTLEQIEQKHLDCSSCHEDRHNGIVYMYQGTGAFGVTSKPSSKFLARVSCRGCHIVPMDIPPEKAALSGQTLKAIPEACDACHGPGFAPLVGKWKNALRDAHDETAALLQEIEGAVDRLPEESRIAIAARRLLKNARHNLMFVGASQPIHNPDYALAILNKATEDLNRAKALINQ